MPTAPWWTDADRAETNVAVWALVCALDEMPADHPQRSVAIEATLDWYRGRCLLSRAVWLRRQVLLEHLADVRRIAA